MVAFIVAVILFFFIIFADFTKNMCFAIKGSEGNTETPPDFLMILGYRVKNNEIDGTLRSRIDAAADYLMKNPKVIAIPCGGFTQKDQEKSEAEIMATELIKKGVSKERIILEDKSKTTEENFLNAKAIIDSLGLTDTPKTAFLSSELHLYRAGLHAKKAGFEVTTVPAESPKDVKIKNYIREALILMYMDVQKLGGKKNG